MSTSGACWGSKCNLCCQGGILEIGFWDASQPSSQIERGIAKYAKHSSGCGRARNAAATSSDKAQICLFLLFQPFDPAQWQAMKYEPDTGKLGNQYNFISFCLC